MGKNHRKKNRHLISGSVSDGVGGGNGIAGLVMFGGAVAVTGFIALASFAIKLNKNRTKDPKPQRPSLDNCRKSQEDHETETTQGLRALLQPSTTPTNDTDISSHGETETDMESIKHTCIPEEKIDPLPDLNTISEVVQEIGLSDDSNPESAIGEECLASLFNSQGSQAQNVELELEPQESLKPKETETEDGDVVSEIGEEEGSSKAILNSNEKPAVYCPAQEDFNFEGEGGKIDFQNKEHEAAKTIYYSAASRSFQMTMWLMPMLLPGLLLLLFLLLLTYGSQQFFVLQ